MPPSIAHASSLQISRNGRFLVNGNVVLDRNTGTQQVVTATVAGATIVPLPVGGRFGIGDSGGLLYLVLHQAFIISTVDLVLSDHPATVIRTAPVVYTAVVSAAENRVVFEIPRDPTLVGRQLWSYDVSSGQSTMLEDFDFGTFLGVSQFQPTISNDGTRLVYRRKKPASQTWEAVLHDYTTNSTTVLGPILGSYGNFSITGDGRSAWIHQADGRLVLIAFDTRALTDAGGVHAWIAQREGAPVAGSYNHLFGGYPANLSASSGVVLAVDLAGLICPYLNSATQELDVEIPWEISPGNFTMTLRSSASQFETVLPVGIVDLAPTFERTGTPFDANRPVIAVQPAGIR